MNRRQTGLYNKRVAMMVCALAVVERACGGQSFGVVKHHMETITQSHRCRVGWMVSVLGSPVCC
jgi:hypothetical protein